MRSAVYSVLCILCIVQQTASPTPPVEIFGAIDLQQIEKNLELPIHAEDKAFLTEGVSLSFNLIQIEEETSNSPLFSVYGSNGSISYTTVVTADGRIPQCVITVDTQYNLSVSYTLKNCSNTNIVIELFNSSTDYGTLVNLYQDLLYLNYDKQVSGNADQPGTTIGWCKYEDSYIEGFLNNATNQKAVYDSLTTAQYECIRYSKGGDYCRGIVHTPTNPSGFQLRPGEVPEKSPSYSEFPETTYLKAPCLNPGQTVKLTSDFILYKQSKSLILSHINLDKLSVNGKVDHTDMYKRYELGNLVPGSYISFTAIPYNISSFFHTHHPVLSSTAWTVWDKSFSLNEGCLLSTPSNSSEDFLKIFIGTKQSKESRVVWNAANKGYSLDLQGFCKYPNNELTGSRLSGYYSTPEEASTKCAARPGCSGFILSPNVYMPGKVYQIGYQLVNGSQRKIKAGVTSWLQGYCPAGETGDNKDGWCGHSNQVVKPPGLNTSYTTTFFMGSKALSRALNKCGKTPACSHVEAAWDHERAGTMYSLNLWQGKIVQGNGTVWGLCGENYTSIDAWNSEGNLMVNKQEKAEVFCYERAYPETEGIAVKDLNPSISNSTSSNRCQWALTQMSGRYIAVIHFSSEELASKFYFTQAPAIASPGSESNLTEQFKQHNRSSIGVFLFKFELAARTERIEVTSGPTNCSIDVYRTDVCEPSWERNNYGSYYTKRTTVGEIDEIECDGDSDKKSSWKCKSSGKWNYTGGCPFFECYQKAGKTHDALYVGEGAPEIQPMMSGASETGECCNSNWSFTCKEGYKVDYSGCEKLKSCTRDSIKISVLESTTDNSMKQYEVAVPSSLAAKARATLDCPYGTGKVYVYCDGCMDRTKLEVKVQACGPKMCPRSRIFNDPVYGRVNITFTAAPVYGDSTTAGCPYPGPTAAPGVFTATCLGGFIKGNYSECGKAPQCTSETTDMGGGQIVQWKAGDSTIIMPSWYTLFIKGDGFIGLRLYTTNTEQIGFLNLRKDSQSISFNSSTSIKLPCDNRTFQLSSNATHLSVKCVNVSSSGIRQLREGIHLELPKEISYENSSSIAGCSVNRIRKIGFNASHDVSFDTGCAPGSIVWPKVYATQQAISDCPYGGSANRNCSWNGTWASPISTCQKRTYCELTEHVYNNVTFSSYNATAGSLSITACDHAMCKGFRNIEATKQCGYRICNGDNGEFGEANYSHCSFNCTDSKGDNVILGEKSIETCSLSDGSEGKRDVLCKGDGKLYALTEGCLLKTCTDDNPAGCFSSDVSKSSKNELMAALASGVDKLDLTSDANKDLVRGAVSKLVPTEPDESASASDLLKIVDLVSKVANRLSQTGGSIETEAVTMYGVLLGNGTRRKRAVFNNEDIGISGKGFTSGVGVSVYKDDAMFKSSTNTSTVAGEVMSITTKGSMDSISMQFEVPAEKKSSNMSLFDCVYYDTGDGILINLSIMCNNKAKFTWSSEGCGNASLVEGKLLCECDHLTSFAVLVSLSEINDVGQDMASGVLLTVSAVCLMLTLCAILPHKKIREKLIMKVHLNLIFSLLLATIAFLFVEYGNNKPGLCFLLAFLVHWLWLAVFGWMVVEGVTLYRQTVKALQSYGRKVPWYMLKNTVAVYGGALIFPTLGIILGQTTSWEYTTQPICFLHKEHTLLAFFLIPLYIVLVVSIFFFVRVSYVIIKAKRQGTAGKEYWKRQLKAVISIAVVLGLAWVIAPLINIPSAGSTAAKVLNWMFIIICGSQGITVFLIHVVFSDDVKASWMGTYKDSELEKMGSSVMNKSRKFRGAVRATVTSNMLMRSSKSNGDPSNGQNIGSSSDGKDLVEKGGESEPIYDGESEPIYDMPIMTKESPEYMDPDMVKQPIVAEVKRID